MLTLFHGEQVISKINTLPINDEVKTKLAKQIDEFTTNLVDLS
jgi:hypothetical protein